MKLQLRIQPSKTKTTAVPAEDYRRDVVLVLIGKLVLEVPHSDSKRLEDRFYPEHHERKILLPGMDLTWSRSLQTLMKGWEMR